MSVGDLITLGTIIEAVSSDVESFAAGAVFYQVCTHGLATAYGSLILRRSATRP